MRILPGLCLCGLFIASMIIRFVGKMKRIKDVEGPQAMYEFNDETKAQIRQMFEEDMDTDTYFVVDEDGRLREIDKHPI